MRVFNKQEQEKYEKLEAYVNRVVTNKGVLENIIQMMDELVEELLNTEEREIVEREVRLSELRGIIYRLGKAESRGL